MIEPNTESNFFSTIVKKQNFIIYGVIIASCIVMIITTSAKNETSFIAFRSSYMALLCAIIFTLAINWKTMAKTNLLMSILPLIILIIIIAFLIILLYKYSDRIIGNNVSEYYTSFMNMSTILVLVQLIIIMKGFFDIDSGKSTTIQPKMIALLLLLGTINMIIVITLGVILKSYITDG
jgi:hypothetical protein